MREMRAGERKTTSSRSTPVSGGTSMRTGRGRPVRICLKASKMASGTSRGLITRPLPLGYRFQHAGLIHYFVDASNVFVDLSTWDLPGDKYRTGEQRAKAFAMPDAAL